MISGIGGTGKTTLAAEIAIRVLAHHPSRILISLAGPLTLESLLGAVISTVRRELLIRGGEGEITVRALDAAGRADLSWQERLAILRQHVLGQVPVLLLLDNFEDNLTPHETSYEVRDQVLAGLLAGWVTDPGASRLLITSRYAFTLAGGAEQGLSFRPLGALSRAETMKLAWSLPALDQLSEDELDQVWRLAGGHPRSLEYLDALLSGGTARYPDVTARLNEAISQRLDGTERGQWLAAHTSLEAALAQTVTLAAADVLLDDLLSQLSQTPGAADLLLDISVYREPVDRNAVLFQGGEADPSAEDIPDRQAANEEMASLLAAAGISTDQPVYFDDLPAELQARVGPHLAELNRPPTPPFRAAPGLRQQLAACQTASLLTVSGQDGQLRFFVHRWTATELATRSTEELTARTLGESDRFLVKAHLRAARYWQWRVERWPQDEVANVHDLLESRYHLLQAGDTRAAGQVTEYACGQLHTWGAWDQETSLIHDTLAQLPGNSPRRVALILQLGVLAQGRGDYDEAARQYQRSLDIAERVGDQKAMASGYHNLGVLAGGRGDYDEAARQYQRSLDILNRLGDQDAMASGYHNLGVLAQGRGDYDEAARQYQRSLDIAKRVGDQKAMASGYHNLGVLAQGRGDYDEAARQYQRSHNILNRLGDQEAMADSYRQLGVLAQDRGDYEEAARQYQRSLDIAERLGDQDAMASGYHNLGMLAQGRGDYDEAGRQYQRSLDIAERVGNQKAMASGYHQLGILAQYCGDYDKAGRQYQRSHDIFDRLGDQYGMARSCQQFGMLACLQGDYDEAARQFQRSLDIKERLGDQAGMANSYSQLGILEADRDGPATTAIAWHVKALGIRLRLGVPQAVIDLRRLAIHRREFGAERFAMLLARTTDDAELIEAIPSLLNQVDAAEGNTT